MAIVMQEPKLVTYTGKGKPFKMPIRVLRESLYPSVVADWINGLELTPEPQGVPDEAYVNSVLARGRGAVDVERTQRVREKLISHAPSVMARHAINGLGWNRAIYVKRVRGCSIAYEGIESLDELAQVKGYILGKGAAQTIAHMRARRSQFLNVEEDLRFTPDTSGVGVKRPTHMDNVYAYSIEKLLKI